MFLLNLLRGFEVNKIKFKIDLKVMIDEDTLDEVVGPVSTLLKKFSAC